MLNRTFIVELSERALTTYVLSFAMLAVAAPTFHITIGAALAWAILPAGLDVVRGLVAGAFGSPHNTHFSAVITEDEAEIAPRSVLARAA